MPEGPTTEDRVTAIEQGLKEGETLPDVNRIRELTLRLQALTKKEAEGASLKAQRLLLQAKIKGLSKPSTRTNLTAFGLTAGLAAISLHQGYSTWHDFTILPHALDQLKIAILTFHPSLNIAGMLAEHNEGVNDAWNYVGDLVSQTAHHARNTAIAGAGAVANHIIRPVYRIRRAMRHIPVK